MVKMDFSDALTMLKRGYCIQRNGWNGKDMYIELIKHGTKHNGYPLNDCIAMKTADDKYQLGWLASQQDLLAEDWCIVHNTTEA